MKLTVFFKLQWKRILKNIPFLLMLALFPVCLFLLSRAFGGEEDSRIPVGLCLSTEDPLAKNVCDKLVELDDSLFSFRLITSKEELLKKVQSNQLECGYLFEKKLGSELDKNRLKNLITVYVSAGTTCTGVLNELIYANLFEEYSLSLLQENLTEAGHLPFTDKAAKEFSLPPVTPDLVENYYRSHLSDGSTFRIQVEFVEDTVITPLSGTQTATVPLLRGFTALFLLLCGFLALLTSYHDEKNGLYARLHGTPRFLAPRLTQLAYLLPSGAVSLLGLFVSGTGTGFGKELLALICYLMALLVFYGILGTLIRNHTVLCAAFPMVLLCTLVFTPVITDLSFFFPWMKAVRYILPAYYYFLFF